MEIKSTNYQPLKENEHDFKMDSNQQENNMVHKLVCGYLTDIVSDKEIIPSIIEESCIAFFGNYGVDGDLIIDSNTTSKLEEKECYQFSSISIKQGGKLTVSNSKQILNIICFGDIVLEENAEINLDGMGYNGGQESSHKMGTGESYDKRSCCYCCGCPDHGGGGYGGGIDFFCCWGGGGGYGGYGGYCLWCCCQCCVNPCLYVPCCIDEECYHCCGGWGGFKYGDKELSILHFGSGGGFGGNGDNGRSGGGAMKIQCFGNLRLKQSAKITANGHGEYRDDPYECNGCGAMGGGGSGGSIHIILNDVRNIQMMESSMISSVGGRGGICCCFYCGNGGGVGRIRLQFMALDEEQMDVFNERGYNIKPSPYIG